MMVRYKGTHCPIRQYMPNKPLKWGLKVWYLACSVSKYVWNFDFYCGKNATRNLAANPIVNPPIVPLEVPIVNALLDPNEPQVVPPIPLVEPEVVQPPQPLVPPRARRGEAKLAHEVVLKLVSGLEGKGGQS
jgi:hypothetical protein